MKVTIVGNGWVGLAQPTRLAEVWHRMCGRDVDASRLADGSDFICVEDINGAPDLSCYAAGKGPQGRGV